MIGWLGTFLLNPALAVGSAAIASPILIHIFSKRRYRRVKWAAMEFLLDAQRRNRRRVKLEQLILLALRCLAMLLIALMVARPFLRAGAAATLVGAKGRTERIILLDDSFSMGYRLPDGQTTFDLARTSAKQMIKWISADAPEDTLTLITTSRPKIPALALANLSEAGMRQLNDAVDALAPSQSSAHFPEANTAIAEMVRSNAAQANTALYIISDFQRHDWLGAAAETSSPEKSATQKIAAAVAPLADLAKQRTSFKIALVDVGADSPKNIAVVDLTSVQPRITTGVPARFEVAVANYSPAPLNQVELSLTTSQHSLPPVTIPRILPGQTVREPLEVAFSQEGGDSLKVQLTGTAANGEPLPLDNSRATAVSVITAVQVLLVDGEPSSDSLRDEAYLLKTALHPTGRSSSGNEVTVVTTQELDGVEWNKYQVVILANVPRLSDSARQAIDKFIQDGGGVIVFAGDLIDTDYYNRELYQGGRGWLPAVLSETVQAPPRADPFTFADWDSNHPVLRAFAGPLAAVLRQVRVIEFISAQLNDISATQPSATTQPAPSLVLATFSDARHSPAIIAHPYGNGRAILITTSADQEWNDWAANFSYVPLMLELIQFTAKPDDAISQTVVGSPIVYPYDLAAFNRQARLRSPAYPVDPEIALEATTGEAGHSILTYNDTTKSGLWSLELSNLTGQPVRRYVAVNPDASESDLTRVSRVELDSAMGDLKFDYVRDIAAFTRDTAAARTEIWWPLLVGAIVALMTEHSLAWYFGTKG